MRTSAGGAWAASLVFLVAACGTRPAPTDPGPTKAEKPAPPAAAGGRITVHVPDMTKVLNLV